MSIVPGICTVDGDRAADRDAAFGLPKLKSVGAGNADELGGAIRRAGGRTGNGFGAAGGLASGGDGIGARNGLTRGGGNGSGACSVGAGATVAGGGVSTDGGASTGAGGGGAGGGGAGLAGSGADGDGSGTGGGVVAGGAGGAGVGTTCVGGVTGVGASVAGGADGIACRLGFGSVGPLFRPLSNSIVTSDGGGSCSGVGSRRIVSSSRRPIATWTSSEISAASLIRQGRRRGG
jgi:hypothetical protein